MRREFIALLVTLVLPLSLATPARAQSVSASPSFASPLTLQQRPESIYAPPAPPREDEGINEGAVHLDLTVRYMTDYIFRGVDRSEVGGREDAPNLQFDGKLDFDLGKFPHPFIALFVNVYDSDPISNFQEVRPVIGFDWPIKPLTISGGNTTYLFPDRDEINTNEVFFQGRAGRCVHLEHRAADLLAVRVGRVRLRPLERLVFRIGREARLRLRRLRLRADAAR